MNESINIEYSYVFVSVLRKVKLKTKNRLVLRYWNKNSLVVKLDQPKLLIGISIVIKVLKETKTDSSFLNASFRIAGYSMVFRLDCNSFG